jgi:hypothetical protein
LDLNYLVDVSVVCTSCWSKYNTARSKFGFEIQNSNDVMLSALVATQRV